MRAGSRLDRAMRLNRDAPRGTGRRPIRSRLSPVLCLVLVALQLILASCSIGPPAATPVVATPTPEAAQATATPLPPTRAASATGAALPGVATPIASPHATPRAGSPVAAVG